MHPSVPTSQPDLWTDKRYRPEASHSRQRKPGVSGIRSPSRTSLGRDRDRAAGIACGAATSPTDMALAEDGPRYRRSVGQSPRLTAIARDCSARVIGITWIEISTADIMPWDVKGPSTKSAGYSAFRR